MSLACARRRLSGYTQKVPILLATTNAGKLAEVKEILGEHIELIGLNALESTHEIEIGTTFVENALLKARHYCKISGIPTISDDSGLEVDALNGAPGIHSARFGGADATDKDRIQLLIQQMRGVPPQKRAARFTCAAAIVWAKGEKVFLEQVEGKILEAPQGENGFGFDPVFYYEPFGKTFAEISSSAKSGVSHRGRAFRRLSEWLTESRVLEH
jgi:XTP/dITP diphosphohydrolase